MTRLALACSILIVSACAARGPSPRVVAELGKADALLREGCYTCLKEAQAIYERLAASPKPAPGAAQGAFDAALLIAIRERELGIFPRSTVDRARQLALAIPPPVKPAVPPPISTSALLDAAELFIGDTSGMDPEGRAQWAGRGRPPLDPKNPQRRALDAAVQTNLVAEYLALAIDCEQTTLRDAIDPAAILARRGGLPLMRFRLAICPRSGGPPAVSIREANPRFTDTMLSEARTERAGTPGREIDLLKVVAILTDARTAFPMSFPMTLLWAASNQSLAEFEAALSGFDDVLGSSPTHRDAMLGRLTSLSYLMRHQDAIAAATAMIDLGSWHIGDAYYWRAWNYYNLKELEPAWQDVEKALTQLANSSVYMLAGLIEYGRVNLPMAIERFEMSFKMDSTNCDAVWMSALVNVDQQAWAPASPKFSRAMSCFVTAAASAKDDLDRLEAAIVRRCGSCLSAVAPGAKAEEPPAGSEPSPNAPTARELKRRDTYRKAIATAEERSAQSAFNAAQGYARMGQKGPALTHADVAAGHPRMKEKADALRAAIEKMP